jgi:hypothetical protein
MDHCDRCAAVGRHRWKKDERTLTFCDHHSREYTYGLVSDGFEIDRDEEQSLVDV